MSYTLPLSFYNSSHTLISEINSLSNNIKGLRAPLYSSLWLKDCQNFQTWFSVPNIVIQVHLHDMENVFNRIEVTASFRDSNFCAPVLYQAHFAFPVFCDVSQYCKKNHTFVFGHLLNISHSLSCSTSFWQLHLCQEQF